MASDDKSKNIDISDFEFRFFVEHGYMPDERQKEAIHSTVNTNKKITHNDIKNIEDTREEDSYREFAQALGIEPLPKLKQYSDTQNIETSETRETSIELTTEASVEDNYREFTNALGMPNQKNKELTKQKKPTKISQHTTLTSINESVNSNSNKQPLDIQKEDTYTTEDKARLYAELDRGLGDMPLGNIEKDDSGRKPKNRYNPKKPNKNEICPEAKLDLHGDTQSIAKGRIHTFINRSISKGYKQVIIVHGKGLNSPGGKGVLKDVVECYAQIEGAHLIKSMIKAPREYGGSGAKIIFL